MFFFGSFLNLGSWSNRYIKELGIQRVIDHLRERGLPCEWPLCVPDPEYPATLKAAATKNSYKSQCPFYGGYWLCGGTGGVECAAAGEIVPGCVWNELCEKRHEDCPFYKEMEDGKQ